jgi:hypothetical protein
MLAQKPKQLARLIFERIFRPDKATECRLTLATRGLIPALAGTRSMSAKDRVRVAFWLNEVLKHTPEDSDAFRGVIAGMRNYLRHASRVPKQDGASLVSYLTELLRQRVDQRDLAESVDIDFSPAELAALKNSHLLSSAWRLLVPMFISREDIPANLEQVYCFGCAHGDTVTALKLAFDRQGLKLPHLNLFDSFAGLPSEQEGVTSNPLWCKGAYAADIGRLQRTLRSIGIPASEHSIYEGFYRDSLNPDVARAGSLKPALYIDVDCDLYVSTYQALDFMFANGLATRGTYIGYDDWGDTKLWLEGESRAHKEISRKYGVRLSQCFSWGRAPVIRKLFRVLDTGSGAVDFAPG